MEQYFPLLLLGLLIVVYYFFLIKPQRKREREIKEMRDSLKVGDEIITIGGFMGRVSKIKDESLVVEIGADRVKLEIQKWGISSKVNKDSSDDKDE